MLSYVGYLPFDLLCGLCDEESDGVGRDLRAPRVDRDLDSPDYSTTQESYRVLGMRLCVCYLIFCLILLICKLSLYPIDGRCNSRQKKIKKISLFHTLFLCNPKIIKMNTKGLLNRLRVKHCIRDIFNSDYCLFYYILLCLPFN